MIRLSKESLSWLNQNVLVGFTDKRGHAWHYRASDQGSEPNHYPGAIPVADIVRRLFHWQATSCAVKVAMPDGSDKIDPNQQAIVRSDTGVILGYHSEGWQSHPYDKWLLNNLSSIFDGDLSPGSAGLLKDGAVAWVSAEVPDTVTTPEGVEYRPHIVATTSFDGSLASTYKRAVTLVVCDNTLNAAMRERGQQVKVKHTRNSELRLADAREALEIVYQVGDDFAAEVKRLCETSVSDKQWSQFLDAHVDMPKEHGRKRTIAETKRASLVKLWSWDSRVSPWKGTAFGVLQATNTWLHHESTMRNANARAERNMMNVLTNKTAEHDAEVMSTLGKILTAS